MFLWRVYVCLTGLRISSESEVLVLSSGCSPALSKPPERPAECWPPPLLPLTRRWGEAPRLPGPAPVVNVPPPPTVNEPWSGELDATWGGGWVAIGDVRCWWRLPLARGAGIESRTEPEPEPATKYKKKIYIIFSFIKSITSNKNINKNENTTKKPDIGYQQPLNTLL